MKFIRRCREIEVCGNELGAKEGRLCVVEGLIREREKELRVKDDELDNIHRECEWKVEELKGLSVRIDDCKKELRVKEEEVDSMQRLIDGEGKELEFKRRNLLKSMQVKINLIEKKEKKLEEGMKDLELMKKQFEGRVKEFESKEKQYGGQGKELKVKERRFKERVKEFESKEKQFEGRVKEIELREKHFEGKAKDIELKRNQYEEKLKELELKEAQFNEQLKELSSKEKEIGDLEFKKNQYEGQLKELELKEAQFRLALKKLESEENQFEGRLKDLQSKQDQLGRQQKELELKEKRCESLRKSFEEGQVLKGKSNILLHQVKAEPQDLTDVGSINNCKNLQLLFNLLKNYALVCSQVPDALRASADSSIVVLDTIKSSCPPQLRQEVAECDANISRAIRNLLIDELKKSSPVISSLAKQEAIKFASDWKVNIAAPDTDCLEILDFFKFVATYEIGSSFNEHELQRLLDIIAQHCQAQKALGNIEKLPDNQICSTNADGRNLQLLSNEPASIGHDILACLQTSSDPATLVLDIIYNAIVPQKRKENEGVIIDWSHITLLDQLMRISPSPHIRPQTRGAAKKLAMDLKANFYPIDENSSGVLGFLLLLSIYGLVSFFNEDEVLKLFELVAQHKLAVELFRTLGFSDKISDLVENLIMKKRYVGAVRFICAYKLTDKIDPVGLLRLQIARANQLFRYGRKKPIAKKVRGKDLEIRILGEVLQCISDNNLGSQDLVNEIQDRILAIKQEKEELFVLQKQTEELGHLVSKLKTQEVHQPEDNKCAKEAFPENQEQQPEEKINADITVTENQFKVQQPKEKESANGAVTKNEVKVKQPEENKSANGAVTKHQAKVQHAEAKKPVKGVQHKAQLYVKGVQQRPQLYPHGAISKRKAKKLRMQSANGAVTLNQAKVRQPKAKKPANVAVTVDQVKVQQPEAQNKRPIEAVLNNHPLHQPGLDNKRPRTGEPRSLPPRVFTSHYQHSFYPSGMPSPLGLPPDYYGVAGGANYFCHPSPYPPFR
ncbi:uncharacterized protein LOC130747812 [Lotus japonicus]|uniref:uncharacterized protein LOC130747812 n=1 Tax=Lotus japonicus TaxID=34305 RepID=UPI00258EFEE4|nr:uncharacterized protein LOC130747812 [Lotus japonicus]